MAPPPWWTERVFFRRLALDPDIDKNALPLIANLPVEVVLKIFSNLGVTDLASVRRTWSSWAFLVDDWNLLRPNCAIAFENSIFALLCHARPAAVSDQDQDDLKVVRTPYGPVTVNTRIIGRLPVIASHLDIFTEALTNFYGSTLRLSDLLWADDSGSSNAAVGKHSSITQQDSNRLLRILEAQPNMARQVKRLDLRNTYWYNYRVPFARLLAVFPKLKTLTMEEGRDYRDMPQFLTQYGYPVMDVFIPNRPYFPNELDLPEAAATVLRNLTSFTAKSQLRGSRTSRSGEYRNFFYRMVSLGSRYGFVPRTLHYAAQYCTHLVELDLHDHQIMANADCIHAYYRNFFKRASKIVRANANTLRSLKLSTVNMDHVREANSKLRPQPTDPEDHRTVYDKPSDQHNVAFRWFIVLFCHQWTNDNMDELGDWDEDDETLLTPFSQDWRQRFPPWGELGLKLRRLHLGFYLADFFQFPWATEGHLGKPFALQLMEFLTTQAQLEEFRFGQLRLDPNSTQLTQSELITRLVGSCPPTCHVSIDVAEQVSPGMSYMELMEWAYNPARRLEREEGFTSEESPFPLAFGRDEIIAQGESFVKLGEGGRGAVNGPGRGQNQSRRVELRFNYVNWLDLEHSQVRLNVVSLTSIHIAQPGVSEERRMTIRDCDLQLIITEAKNLKELRLEYCQMKDVTDVGLTGLNGLTELRELTLIGLGSKVTDISARNTFSGLRLRSLILSEPNFTNEGVIALRRQLRASCGSFVSAFQIITSPVSAPAAGDHDHDPNL